MGNKTLFHELILECPLNIPEVTCPYHDIRKLSLTELIDYNRKLNRKERTELFKLHKKCMKSRVKKKKN